MPSTQPPTLAPCFSHLPGLDTSNPDLAAKPNIITGSVPDFRNGTTWSWQVDSSGHGTHVAGTIAALSNSFGVVGVAGQGVRLHMANIFGDGTDAADSVIYSAVATCRAKLAELKKTSPGMRMVVSMSFGGSALSYLNHPDYREASKSLELLMDAWYDSGEVGAS
jgi:hypothetical protein